MQSNKATPARESFVYWSISMEAVQVVNLPWSLLLITSASALSKSISGMIGRQARCRLKKQMKFEVWKSEVGRNAPVCTYRRVIAYVLVVSMMCVRPPEECSWPTCALLFSLFNSKIDRSYFVVLLCIFLSLVWVLYKLIKSALPEVDGDDDYRSRWSTS